MKKTTILGIFLFLCLSQLVAQKKPSYDPFTLDYSANTFFAEFAGQGGILSANYDRRFSKDMSGMGMRMGIGLVRNDIITSGGLSLPIAVNYITGKAANHFEFGVGATPSFGNGASGSVVDLAPNVCLAYRYHNPAKNGLNFRVGFTPIIRTSSLLPFFTPWAGISLGYSFK